MPEVKRLDYQSHIQNAAPEDPADPGHRGAIAHEAARLRPLQEIQVNFDQVIQKAEARARGEPWPYGGSFEEHCAAALEHAQRRSEVLRCAADAADSIIAELKSTIVPGEPAMSTEDPNQGPQLTTTTGEPHPLQEGGYDANADPGLPSNISDVEAMKEGKTTRKEAEALGAADTKDNTAESQPAAQAPVEAEAQADAGAGDAAVASTEGATFTDEPRKGRNRR